jgi:hypothetical protein
VHGVTVVVTNIELVVVHISRFLKPPFEGIASRRRVNSFRLGSNSRPSWIP